MDRIYYNWFSSIDWFILPLYIKNPDSSPASVIRERNYRDCDANLVIIWHTTNSFSIKFFQTSGWNAIFPNTPGLSNLNRYITNAIKQISGRREQITPPKVIAELTLGFWVSLLNSEYERILWKDLRRAFPYMPKNKRQRKNVSAPLNRFRAFRNRVFHNESICWNITRVSEIHNEIIEVIGWINKDMPNWLAQLDRVSVVSSDIIQIMDWKN